MPTSTLPFEILLEFTNDTLQSFTLQVDPSDLGFSTTATISLQPEDTISLVLTAGATYRYLLRQKDRRAHISVKVWKDAQISATDVFVKKKYAPLAEHHATNLQGITAVCQDD